MLRAALDLVEPSIIKYDDIEIGDFVTLDLTIGKLCVSLHKVMAQAVTRGVIISTLYTVQQKA